MSRITTRNVRSLTVPDGISLTYTYDGSLLTGTTWSGPIAGSVTRTYDTDFRVSSQSVNGANPVAFTYDPDSLLTGAGSLTLTRSLSNGLLTDTALGNVTDTRTYNSFAESLAYTASVSSAPFYAAQYTRDQLFRSTQQVETVGSVPTTFDYSYDLAGRLSQVQQNGSTTASYTYDSNGNRLTGPGLTSAPIYDDQDRLLQYGPNRYTYTANGELATKTVGSNLTTYTYDELGSLTRVVLPGGAQIDYLIDGQNRRIGKKIGGTLVQGFLYQNQLNPVAELDGAGTVVSRFVYGSRVNVPDYMIKGGVTYRITSDHLGSPRLIVDVATGTVAQQLDYDEFGNVLTDTHPGFQPFGFAGGLYDPDTGLVRFGARDYDAETGRWTTKDPILFNGEDSNLFAYVQSDPINFVDPYGLYKFAPGAQGPFTPTLDSALKCFEKCAGDEVTVTSGLRSGNKGPHGSGNACDLGRKANPQLDRETAKSCFASCFAPNQSYGQEEWNSPGIGGTHFHFQTKPGRGGRTGFADPIKPYQP